MFSCRALLSLALALPAVAFAWAECPYQEVGNHGILHICESVQQALADCNSEGADIVASWEGYTGYQCQPAGGGYRLVISADDGEGWSDTWMQSGFTYPRPPEGYSYQHPGPEQYGWFGTLAYCRYEGEAFSGFHNITFDFQGCLSEDQALQECERFNAGAGPFGGVAAACVVEDGALTYQVGGFPLIRFQVSADPGFLDWEPTSDAPDDPLCQLVGGPGPYVGGLGGDRAGFVLCPDNVTRDAECARWAAKYLQVYGGYSAACEVNADGYAAIAHRSTPGGIKEFVRPRARHRIRVSGFYGDSPMALAFGGPSYQLDPPFQLVLPDRETAHAACLHRLQHDPQHSVKDACLQPHLGRSHNPALGFVNGGFCLWVLPASGDPYCATFFDWAGDRDSGGITRAECGQLPQCDADPAVCAVHLEAHHLRCAAEGFGQAAQAACEHPPSCAGGSASCASVWLAAAAACESSGSLSLSGVGLPPSAAQQGQHHLAVALRSLECGAAPLPWCAEGAGVAAWDALRAAVGAEVAQLAGAIDATSAALVTGSEARREDAAAALQLPEPGAPPAMLAPWVELLPEPAQGLYASRVCPLSPGPLISERAAIAFCDTGNSLASIVVTLLGSLLGVLVYRGAL